MIIQWIMLMTFISFIPWFIQGAIAVVTIFEIYHISDKRIDITRWILSYGTLVALKYSSQTSVPNSTPNLILLCGRHCRGFGRGLCFLICTAFLKLSMKHVKFLTITM